MTEIITKTEYEIMTLSAEQRMAELKRALEDSRLSMRKAATIYLAMEQAGDDVSQVPLHIRRFLKRIAADRMLPEVMQLTGRLRDATAKLSLIEQEKIVRGEPIEIALEGGSVSVIDPRKLEPSQIKVVFGEGYIRSPEEQKIFFQRTQAKNRTDRRARTTVEYEIDRERGGIVIDGKFISKKALLNILEEI